LQDQLLCAEVFKRQVGEALQDYIEEVSGCILEPDTSG